MEIKDTKVIYAPLQGYTDRVYRTAHQKLAGGVEAYYTPFLRFEHGEVRRKDLRDIAACEESAMWVPQVIARDTDEFCHLCDAVQNAGYRQVDINMGCPFPMQARAGRGSGLLAHGDRIEALLKEAATRNDCRFSAKLRLGWDNGEEAQRLLPILNDSCLVALTLHPRVGRQQYKGTVDLEAFGRFYDGCRKPLYYNGDIHSAAEAREVVEQFPRLAGVMIGRGLMANPLLAREIHGESFSEAERRKLLQGLHNTVYEHATSALCGDAQVLARMRAFWEYQESALPHRSFKHLMKSNNLNSYQEAIREIW